MPKYIRDWTTVVEKMVKSSEPEMVKIAKTNGLLVSIEKSGDMTDFEFDDPVSHESVLVVTQIVCSFPVPARAEQLSKRVAPK